MTHRLSGVLGILAKQVLGIGSFGFRAHATLQVAGQLHWLLIVAVAAAVPVAALVVLCEDGRNDGSNVDD